MGLHPRPCPVHRAPVAVPGGRLHRRGVPPGAALGPRPAQGCDAAGVRCLAGVRCIRDGGAPCGAALYCGGGGGEGHVWGGGDMGCVMSGSGTQPGLATLCAPVWAWPPRDRPIYPLLCSLGSAGGASCIAHRHSAAAAADRPRVTLVHRRPQRPPPPPPPVPGPCSRPSGVRGPYSPPSRAAAFCCTARGINGGVGACGAGGQGVDHIRGLVRYPVRCT